MEYDKAKNLGISGQDIIFNGPHKPYDTLLAAIKEGATVNIDHFEEIEDLEKIAAILDKILTVGIRINLDTGIEPCLEEIKQLEPQEQLIYVLEQARQKNLVSEDVDLTQIQHLLEINKLNIQALGNYQPQSYSGSMIVIQASETNTDLASVWGELVEKVDAYMIPGNHYNMVRNPQVQRLAQILPKYLARL